MNIGIKDSAIAQFCIDCYKNTINRSNKIYSLIIIFALISCTHSGNSTLNHYDNNGGEDEVKDTYLVDQTSDHDSLLKVAHTDKSVKVRKAAVERITDKDFLIEVAQTDKASIIQLAAARTIQYLLDKEQFTDYRNIKKDVADLMLFLLDPVIIERHGLLKLEIETDRDYIISIKTLSGDTILKRTFITTPPAESEHLAGTAKYKDSKIDYDGIKTLLWFLSSTK